MNQILNHLRKRRLLAEKALSTVIPNELAFKISDVGNSYDIDQYDAPICPFEQYNVSPSKIQKITGRSWKPWSNSVSLIGKVMDGNWDKQKPASPSDKEYRYPKHFEEYSFHQAAVEYFIHGADWSETKHFKRKMKEGWSEKRLYEAYAEFVQLYQKICENGYKTQDQLKAHQKSKRTRYTGEILVDIGRDGELLFVDGRHRLSIAKILDLETVPVSVLVRHEKWMEYLEGITNQPTNTSHPEAQKCIENYESL